MEHGGIVKDNRFDPFIDIFNLYGIDGAANDGSFVIV